LVRWRRARAPATCPLGLIAPGCTVALSLKGLL
jgi:hypothetical protein